MAEIKKISTELQLLDKFLDTSGDAGTSGQVLTSTGTGINWVSGGSLPGGPYLPLAGGTMTGNVIFPGEEANSFKIAFTGASASSGLSTVDQSGAGLYIGANSRVNTSGVVVYHDSALPSSGIYFDGWLGDDMEFYTGSSGNPTKRLTIKAGGDAIFTEKVGIGTTGPQAKLEIAGSTEARYLQVDAIAGFAGLSSGLAGMVEFTNAGDGNNVVIKTNNSVRTDAAPFSVYTASISRFVIRNDGNIGIGTTSPQSKLHIETGSGGTYNPNTNHDDVTIEGSGNIGLQLFSPNTSYQYIAFGDPNSVNAGYLRYYHGANEMVFRTNGNDNMIIDGNGNVGIATTSPRGKLQINGNGNSWNEGPSVRLWDTTNSKGWLIGNINNYTAGDFYIRTFSSVNTNPTSSSQEFIIKHATGNVGIGTASPGAKLEVVGSLFFRDFVRGYVGSGTTQYVGATWLNASDGVFYVRSADVNKVVLDSNGNSYLNGGNVGIGTTSPGEKLEVTGNFKLNGTTVQEGTGNNLTFKYRTTHSSVYTGGNATCKFGRFYWTPAHWVNTAPVIKVTLQSKYYQGEQRQYIIKAGYQNTDPIINELQPSSTSQKITLLVGATTSAGYNYANQPVYYVDLQWVQSAYMWGWAQIESQVSFLTSNPTSGWGGVVLDSSITQTNNSGAIQDYNSFFNGNVGIGTASVVSKLEVNGSIKATGITASIGSDPGVSLSYDTSNNIGLIETWASKPLLTRTYNYQAFSIGTNEKMRITSTGIGIGTTNPAVPLDVEGKIRSNDSNSGDYLEIFCDGSVSGDSYIENTNNNIQIKSAFATSFSTSGSVAMFIKNNQNVGIGTTNPQQPFVVSNTTNGQGIEIVPGASGIIQAYDRTVGDYIPLYFDAKIVQPRATNYFAVSTGNAFTERIRLLANGEFWIKLLSTTTGREASIANDNDKLQIFGSRHGGTNNYVSIWSDGANENAQFHSNKTLFFENVGIGTTSPEQKLHVEGRGIFDGGVSSDILQIRNDSGGGVFGMTSNLFALDLASTSNFRIRQGSTVPLYLKSDGNLGIGMTSPTVKLHVQGAANDGIAVMGVGTTATRVFAGLDGSNHGYLFLAGSSGQNPAKISATGGDSYISGGNVGIGVTGPSTKLHVVGTTLLRTSSGVADLYLGNNGTGNFARFHTNNSNTYFDMNCGVVYWRQGSGTRFQHNMTSGTFTASGDLVAYGSPSDVRLKENIKPIESALDKVGKLQGVTFDWKKSDSILDIKEDIGFIAQDVQKVIPELVRENKDGMLSMRHQGIAPILLEAIKELKAEIEELKSKNCNCNK